MNKKTGEVKILPPIDDINERTYKIRLKEPFVLFVAKQMIADPDVTLKQLQAAAIAPDPVKGRSITTQLGNYIVNARAKGAQDKYIRKAQNHDAYDYLLKQQQDFGYPFHDIVYDDRIVLGSNGDTPQAQATLAGIIQNNGRLVKPDLFWTINRAENTPWSRPGWSVGEAGRQVIKPEVAQSLREDLQGVVREGTGTRIRDLATSDNALKGVTIGGKTGTNRGVIKKANGSIIRVTNLSATFTHVIGDEHDASRFYATTLLYVEGKPAAKAHFTSASAVAFSDLLYKMPAYQAFFRRELTDEFVRHAIPLDLVSNDNDQPERREASAAAGSSILPDFMLKAYQSLVDVLHPIPAAPPKAEAHTDQAAALPRRPGRQITPPSIVN